MKKNILIAIIMIVAIYSNVNSQTINESKDTIKIKNLDEVIITAPRMDMPLKEMPSAISVVNQDKLNTMNKSIAADEVLRLVPGVKVDNGTDGSRVHLYIRGQGVLSESGFRGIQVLIDGIPVNDPGGFCPDLFDVDWSTVKRVEVVKGLAASMYGGSGNGGVVNIITNDGSSNPISNLFSASAGSYGFFKTLEQVDGTQGNVNYRLTYSHTQGNGYRDHQAFMGDNFSEKINWTLNDKVKVLQTLTYTNYFNQNSEGMNLDRIGIGGTILGIQASNMGWQASNNDAIPFNEFHLTQRLTGATTIKYDFAKNQNITLKGFFRMNNYRETSNNGDDYKPYINPGVSAQYNFNFGKENLINHFSLGADYQTETMNEHEFAVPDEYSRDSTRIDSHYSQQSYDLNTILINQTIKEKSLGIYFIDKLDIMKKLYATVNLRYDYFNSELINNIPTPDSLNNAGTKDFQHLTYRFGLAYDISKSTNIYANYGAGFLVPTSDELYNNPETWGGYNQTIKPSTSLGGELGVRGNISNKFNYDVTGFYMNTTNGFYRFSIPGRGNNTAFFGNKDESRTGVEVFLSYAPSKMLKFDVAYTYSYFIYKHDTTDDRYGISTHFIPECPQHMLTAEVAIKLNKNFTLTLNTQFESKWALQVDDSIYNNYTIGQTYYQTYQKCSSWVTAPGHNYGYNIYGAQVNYKWKLGKLNGDISLYAKNIFNQHYFGFTEPNNGVDYNSYQPAPGRELFLSLKIRV